MSYVDLLLEDQVRSRHLAIITPRRKISTWGVYSGFIYSASYSGFPNPLTLEFDGEEMEFVANVGAFTTAGQWTYDATTSTLYLRTPQSSDPDTGQAVMYYPLYCCTSGGESNWYSDPLDDTTDQVYFEPTIKAVPQIKSSTTDTLFGFLPVQSSNMILINSEHWLEPHLYDSSFNQASVKIYHCLGDDLVIENIKQVYDGLIASYNYTDTDVTFVMKDRYDEFSNEYRNPSVSFYNTTDFPNLNPNFIGKPVRYVYGYVQGFVPVNVSYVAESEGVTPTTSDNRTWCVMNETSGISDISRTVSGGSTTTQTNINFAEGITVGDLVWLDRASGTDNYVEVTNVSYSPAYIEHAAIPTPMTSGDLVKKSFVSKVEIVQDNVKYRAMFGRDYTSTFTLAGSTCSGFVFSSSLESNLSMPSTLSPNDSVFCTVYGRSNDLTLGGPAFGANDLETNNITNPVMIIYDLLKNRIGIPESRINGSDFTALRTATATEALGFAIPDSSSAGFKSYKNLIIEILQSSLFKIVLDNDNKWTLKQVAPLGAIEKTIDTGEIIGGYSIAFDHKDILSDVLVEYAYREKSSDLAIQRPTNQQVTATSDYARYHHKVEKQGSFTSLHFRTADAQALANRICFILGERSAAFSFNTGFRFYDSVINDAITVESDRIPGFTHINGTVRSRNAAIVSVTKSSKGVTIEAEDQKGIEDNSGSW